MSILPQFDVPGLQKYISSKRALFERMAEEGYKMACKQMVSRAKSVNTYKDRTGFLRSSIGVVLYHNGVEVYNYFEASPPGAELPHAATGGEGTASGLNYARGLAEEEGQKTFVAVIVAGANYARYVEAKGFDVLTGSSFQFPEDLKEQFELIKEAFDETV